MARPSSHPFDLLAARFAQVVADRLAPLLGRAASTKSGRNGATSKLRGRKLDMRCRYPGCKNRSKGPRFRFMCEEHRKLPKKQQLEALAKTAAKNVSA
jgi:hypothetical protein